MAAPSRLMGMREQFQRKLEAERTRALETQVMPPVSRGGAWDGRVILVVWQFNLEVKLLCVTLVEMCVEM